MSLCPNFLWPLTTLAKAKSLDFLRLLALKSSGPWTGTGIGVDIGIKDAKSTPPSPDFSWYPLKFIAEDQIPNSKSLPTRLLHITASLNPTNQVTKSQYACTHLVPVLKSLDKTSAITIRHSGI
ncbi:3-hydroxyacyl-CoA dehydrogenase-like protein LAM1 [Fusarium oxysporum f. sp. albedinis]|nr:3-hydroxyacyl-CoA dehydrogenase-like protein LAM1 [Fusarium oxysporum f. sp. albedinis]